MRSILLGQKLPATSKDGGAKALAERHGRQVGHYPAHEFLDVSGGGGFEPAAGEGVQGNEIYLAGDAGKKHL